MKILFFLGAPIPFPHASWTRIGFFAKYFREKGHIVDVAGIISPKYVAKAGSRELNGIRVFNLCPTFWTESIFSTIFNVFTSIFTLVPLFLCLRPHLVIISVPNGEPAVGAYLSARLSRAEVIFDYRDEWEDFKINRAKSNITKKMYQFLKVFMNSIYSKSKLVLAVTPNFIKSLKSRDIPRLKLLPNGADVAIFKVYSKYVVRRRLGLSDDDVVIVYSGSIGGCYKLDLVVLALFKLNFSNMKLVIVGDGEDVKNVLSLAENLGTMDNVLFLGAEKDAKKLAEILSACDVGLIPYDDNPLWKNTLSAKFFEYCACGLPVVATCYKDSILAEVILENKIGLVSAPLNVDGLAKAIKKMYLTSPDVRREIGVRARTFIKQNYDRNRIAEEFLDLIKDGN